MRNSFPSTFLPEKSGMLSTFGNKIESSQGRFKGTVYQIAYFKIYLWCILMHFKIPSVVLICPWRLYLVESYWSHLYWLADTPPHNASPRDRGAPGSSHMTITPWLCDSALLLCVFLGYFSCNCVWFSFLGLMVHSPAAILFCKHQVIY